MTHIDKVPANGRLLFINNHRRGILDVLRLGLDDTLVGLNCFLWGHQQIAPSYNPDSIFTYRHLSEKIDKRDIVDNLADLRSTSRELL